MQIQRQSSFRPGACRFGAFRIGGVGALHFGAGCLSAARLGNFVENRE